MFNINTPAKHTSSLINTLVGLPWKKGGRSPEEGFDCWGFLKWYYTHILEIEVNYDYDFLPGDTKRITQAMEAATGKKGQWQKIDMPMDHAAVALSMNKKIHHVGVWLNSGCLHATEGLGIVYNTMQQLNRNGYNKVEFYTCLALS